MEYTIYHEVFDAAPDDYIFQKHIGIANSVHQGEPVKNQLAQLHKRVTQQPTPTKELPTLADADQFFDLNRTKLRRIEISKRCALSGLKATAPLLAGEQIKEDHFTYLTTDYQDVPAGTGALIRTTNYAKTIHLFEGTQITADGLISVDLVAHDEQPLTGPLGDTTSIVGKLLLKMLSSAASSAGSKIGTSIFQAISDELFGSDSDKLAQQIAATLKKEVVENTITEYAGKLQGVISYLTVDYANNKAKSDLSNKEDREKLYEKLETYSQPLYDVIGVLSQERFEEKGLQSYMLATSMHILLYQEAALVDYKTLDPNDSDKFMTLKSRAATFRNHIGRVFNKIVDHRLAKISLQRFSTSTTVDHKTITRDWVTFTDTVDGINMIYGDDKNGKNYEWLKQKYDTHVKDVRSKLRKRYSDPDKNCLPYLSKITSEHYRIT